MFALEISFLDGVSPPEILFVRRPQGLIGASDYAHVMVDDMKSMGFQIRLIRDIGRKFTCKAVDLVDGVEVPPELDRSYEREANISIAGVRLHITALDSDMLVKEGEPPDKAGVRILRRACAQTAPFFPAIVVRGTPPMVVSFMPDQPLLIGRSKHCGLRLDAADISGKHARMGYEAGEFWIEDLGSTNGTYVNQQQISGRVSVPASVPIVLGRELTITGISGEEQITSAIEARPEEARKQPELAGSYPVLFSVSEVARPAKLVLIPGSSVTVGRDPGSDMWLGAPHVSRQHCRISLEQNGVISVTDTSTNGTAFDDGTLLEKETLALQAYPRVLDFGAGVTVAVCFNEEQEREFVLSNGSPWTFSALAKSDALSSEGSAEESQAGHGFEVRSIGALMAFVLQLIAEYRNSSPFGKMAMLMVSVLIGSVMALLVFLLMPIFAKL